MNFISFIASTMLIVLISQHSIMGLPLNDTTVEESCSKGFEIVNGKCMPIDSTTTITEFETSSNSSKNMIINEEQPVTELYTPKIVGACPEGMKHGQHGICEKIQSSSTPKVTLELTTDLNDKQGGVDNVKGCPEGTETDEEGACQQIKPYKPTKIITDPKTFLKGDGSCPDNYKMIEGQCLYIKPKTNSTLYPSDSTADNRVLDGIRPKSGIDESTKFELVPVLSDNSCPEGTEYSEYGLCQRRIHLSSSNPRMKADGSCPDNFELINGKCSYKNVQVSSLAGLSTTTISISGNITPAEGVFTGDKLPKSTTTVGESAYESQTTSSPF
jgi:hypothetical protein